MSISNIINQSSGKWCHTISNFDDFVINYLVQNTDTEILSEPLIELSLEQLPVNIPGLQTRQQWLLAHICMVLQDPNTLEILKKEKSENTKKKLLELITRAMVNNFPHLFAIDAKIMTLIVYFIKRELKKETLQSSQNKAA